MLSSTLLTGGSGLLGTEIQKYMKCYAPKHQELDITSQDSIDNLGVNNKIDCIVHAAAYTDVSKAEIKKVQCFQTNVVGTYRLVMKFNTSYFVYISTEYAVNPVNYYSMTKKWGEEIVQRYCENYLIVRCLFKPKPFPYDYAFFDQITGGDYVDVMTPMILKCILQNQTGIVYLHTGRKTMFELARRTKPDIKAHSIHDITDVVIPEDTFYG